MRWAILAGLSIAVLGAVPAVAYDDPKTLVEAIYEPYVRGATQADLEQFYSRHLKELFAAHASKIAVSTGDSLASVMVDKPAGFNPFIDAQHSLLLDLKVSEPVVIDADAVVTVSFHNFDHPSLLSLALVKEADGWKVDDISSLGKGENWMLSWLLLYDPWDLK